MIRTQLQIDNDIYEALRLKAHQERKSMSALAREILRESLAPGVSGYKTKSKKLSFINSGVSGRTDISVHHDEALAEDFQ